MGADKEKDAKQNTLAVTWGIALLVGVVTCVMLFMFADIGSVTGTVVLAAIVTAVVGFALQWGMKDLAPLDKNVPAGTEPKPSVPEPPAPAPAPPQAPVSADTGVQPTAPLPGQAELASRKGSWKYEAEDAGGGDGTVGASAEGSKPETLSAPRGGGADDLKQMKGVGPKLEQTLHEAGIYHFDQIASWSGDEIAWVEENVDGARGRVTRDDWVGQAKALAK